MIQIELTKTKPRILEAEPLTCGMVKAVEVQFLFSPEWAALEKTAVFSVSKTAVNVILPPNGSCAVPWECLTAAGERLTVGVYGSMGGTVVLPSELCELGVVLPGTSLGQSAAVQPTPTLVEQLMQTAEEAKTAAQSLRADADRGLFNGARGEKGEPGAAATIAIGTVTTAAPGEEGRVTNRGTPEAAILDISLPRGEKGDPGIPGPQGERGPEGFSVARIVSLRLPAANWKGSSVLWSQPVTIPGTTAATKVDLSATHAQLLQLKKDGVLSLYVENADGFLTVQAFGKKPFSDVVLQAALTEIILTA